MEITQVRSQLLCRDDADHERGEAFHWASRLELRLHHTRRETSSNESFKAVRRILRRAGIACSLGIRGIRDCGECLAKNIAPHTEGFTFARHAEIHFPIVCVGMLAAEIHATLGRLQPLGALCHRIVKGSEYPSRPPLEPDALVGIHDGPIPIQTRHDSAVFVVQTVPQPERNDIVEKGVAILGGE